jgi:hypothetical protein
MDSDTSESGISQTECTDKLCEGDAKHALWMGVKFSRVVDAPESVSYEDGDLHPHVCDGCLARYERRHGNKGEFVRPREKIVTDGGQNQSSRERSELERNNRYVATKSLGQERTGHRDRMASDLSQYGDPLMWSRTPSSVAARRTRLIVSSFGGSSSISSRRICRRTSETSRRLLCACTMALQTRSRAVMEPLICSPMSTQPQICCGVLARGHVGAVSATAPLLQHRNRRNARYVGPGTEQSGSDTNGH